MRFLNESSARRVVGAGLVWAALSWSGAFAGAARAEDSASAAESESAATVEVVFHLSDAQTETRTVETTRDGDVDRFVLAADAVPSGTKFVDVFYPLAEANVGDKGFYIFCNGYYGEFLARPGVEKADYVNGNCVMPIFGVATPRGSVLAILTGLRYEAEYRVSLRDGKYRVFPRYKLDGEKPYSDVGIEFHRLAADATYSEMARVYRNYQLEKGVVRPLAERAKGNDVLEYAAASPEIRVRLGWKPVPSPVKEQNAENEPEMKVAISFERFGEIVDEFKRQGIEKAEFCLVGWNIGGHDGRYPQIFPVDPRLGGEEKLRAAIRKAQDAGYRVVCHTNNSDAYQASQIGGLWDENYLLIKKDGQPNTYTTWGGGAMFETCPQPIFERFVQDDLRKIRELGFCGVHYIDVFSTVNPRTCRSEDHPLTKEGYAEWARKIFAEAQKTFGAAGSEGGFDYCISNLDYSLYLSFYNPGAKLPTLIDRFAPFWQLVYHGIVLDNPFTATTNFTIKDRKTALKVVEFGGRPMFYYYSKFRTAGSNWMGDDDLICGTDDELRASVAKVKEGVEIFDQYRDVEKTLMEEHRQIDADVFATRYADGTEIVVNYRDAEFEYRGEKIAPVDFKVFRKE